MRRLRDKRGFTLIELVMIIVILGILAATAIVKYYDLQEDATEAAIRGIYGHMASAYGIAIASVKDNPTVAAVNQHLGGDPGDLTVNGGSSIAIQSGANTIYKANVQGGSFTVGLESGKITSIGNLAMDH